MVTMPVPKGFGVTSNFGPRVLNGRPDTHWGTDFGNGGSAGGHPVFAIKDGTVTRSGPASGFGQWVTVDHDASVGGGESVYGHVIPEVKVGQKVREGQRIARINPDSRTNGGVTPHLHLETHRYTWVPPGPGRLDPMTVLRGAKWVGDSAPAPTSPTGGDKGTILGVDISGHQNGLPLSLAKAQGARFAFIKATEGHTFRDKVFHSHVADARANGLQVAAYLYVWHNSTPAQMAETFAQHVGDTSIPAILDAELNSGYDPNHWRATVRELEKRGYRVPLLYLPHWYWKGHCGSPSLAGLPPLWSSAYPAGGGRLRAAYDKAGGDRGSGWAGYGGLPVLMWQFTESATVGWYVKGVDVGIDGNAFKGGEDGLRALLTGKETEDDFMSSGEGLALLRDIAAMQRDTLIQLTGSHKINDFPGFKPDELATKARAKRAKGEGLTMMETLALLLAEERTTGDQLSGPGRKNDQSRSFTGWDVADVLDVARRRNYVGLTAVQMIVVGFFGTDEDRARVRSQIESEG